LSSRQWDRYWDKKSGPGGLAYDAVSAFYRRFIIRPAVNYFIQKHFEPGKNLLHAGCGSGQTDIYINKKFSVTALDISPRALSLYRRFNPDNPRIICGDISCIPFADGKFDGAYNVGVMEHFSEEDVVRILCELSRIINPDGKIVVFWPPEFGLSVRFLNMIHAILRKVFRQKVRLHPDELTLAKSRSHIEAICAKAGLKIADYYFGPRDFFTQVAVVFKK
jgi:SAM-dependent methyltransferase